MAHWIFASKYFEVAINTKLYLTQQQDKKSIDKKVARNKTIVKMLDVVFYLILLVSAIVVFIENLHEYAETRPFDIFVICKIAAALLLVISICVIRAQVQRFSNRKLSTRDFLMTIHTICFSLSIMSNVLSQIMTAHTTDFK